MSWRFREAKVFRRKNGWFVHITVEKEVEIKQEYNSILAIDLGIKMDCHHFLYCRYKTKILWKRA